jgi:hypothetical protein
MPFVDFGGAREKAEEEIETRNGSVDRKLP